MNVLLAIILLGLSSWALIALFRRLRRQHVGKGWWVATALSIACGLALGVWCTFCCEYHVWPTFRFFSFPVPVAFFHLEDGQWVDFVPEAPLGWFMMLTNVLSITALTTLPLWLASRKRQTHEITGITA